MNVFKTIFDFLKSKLRITLTILLIIFVIILFNLFTFTPLMDVSGTLTILFICLSVIWGKTINIDHENLKKDVYVFATGWLTPASITGMFFIIIFYLALLQGIWI